MHRYPLYAYLRMHGYNADQGGMGAVYKARQKQGQASLAASIPKVLRMVDFYKTDKKLPAKNIPKIFIAF